MLKQHKCIVTAVMARYLLRQGFVITDIKPQKENPDRSIFVFLNTPELQKAMDNYPKINQKKSVM